MTFSAVLLLSVRSQGDSGKMLNEKVFFVDLKSDVEEPTASVKKDASFKKTIVKKMKKEPAVIIDKRDHNEEVMLNDSVSNKKETNLAESLSIDSNETSVIADGSVKIFSYEMMESQGGEENIVSAKTEDDKRAGISNADALKLISAAIERAKTYPSLARRRSIEGTVYVSFFIGAEGKAKEIRVVKSSAYKILDEATVKVIKDAAPYPQINDRVEVPVTYRLND